jgi:PAS domain S-box-containing protein
VENHRSSHACEPSTSNREELELHGRLDELQGALARAEARLKETQRLSRLGSWELDVVSQELHWSEEIYRIFEIDPARFGASYDAFLALVHPDDRERVHAAYEGSVRARQPYDVSHRLHMQDGRVKHVRERGETFYAEDGSPLRSIGTVQDVTSEVEAARAHAQDRALLRTIVDASPDWVFAKDAQQRFLMVNRAFAAGISRAPEELIGHADSEFWPADECQAFHADDRLALSGHIVHRPIEEATVAGKQRVFDTRKGPLYDEQGVIVGSYGYSRDITDPERAARALSASEARLSLIFNATQDLLALVDVEPDGGLTLSAINDAHLATLRRSAPHVRRAADVLGKDRRAFLSGIVGEQEIARGEAMYRQAILEQRQVEYEIRVESPVGTRHYDVTITPVIDYCGRVAHALWAARDTTERTKAIQALRESEARYRAVIEDQTELICRFDQHGTLTFANDAACRFVGFTREQLLSGAYTPFVPEEDLPLIQACLGGLTPEKPVGSVEHRVRLPNGELRLTRWVNRGLFDEQGQLREFQSVGQDITEHHEATRRIAAQLEEKEVLLREIHHRVKNNLQVVSSLLYLQQQQADSSLVIESLRESSARVAAMALIHDRLYGASDLARVDMRAYASELGLSLLSTYGIPSERVKLEVTGDALTLSLERATPCALILNELITNALKHGFPDGRRGTLRITLREVEGALELCVADDGIGAPAGHVDDTSATLGMRLVRRLAAQLRGSFEHVSAPQGTSYLLRVPKEAR